MHTYTYMYIFHIQTHTGTYFIERYRLIWFLIDMCVYVTYIAAEKGLQSRPFRRPLLDCRIGSRCMRVHARVPRPACMCGCSRMCWLCAGAGAREGHMQISTQIALSAHASVCRSAHRRGTHQVPARPTGRLAGGGDASR